MIQEKVNGFQLFVVIFLFELGSALIIGMIESAQQDTWITVIIGIGLGCMLYMVFSKLYVLYPSIPLTSYLQKILGRYPGWIVGLLYVIYFIYISSRVLRDFEELLVITAYRSSSLLTIGIIMIACVMYAAYKGIEVFFRISEITFFIIVFVLFLLIFFETASGIIKLHHLRPILENGWRPIWKSLFPTTLTIPFGEMITFTMLLPFLNKKGIARKVGLFGIASSGIILLIFTLLNIAIVGADIASRSAFPLLTAVSYINIAEFIQRLDILVIISMVLLGFVKITVFFFCALLGAADLFNVKRQKLIYPIGITVLICSLIMAPNYIEHINEGLKFVPYYLHLPFQIVIPCVLLIIALVKNKNTPGM